MKALVRISGVHHIRTCFHNSFWKIQMPFGLRNTPATFQRSMDVVLVKVADFAAAYINDIIL